MSIRDEYAYHKPNPAQQEQMDELRMAYSDLAHLLSTLSVHGRYYNLARNALEESAMWANKAIVLPGVS